MKNAELDFLCKKIAAEITVSNEKERKQNMVRLINKLNGMHSADVSDIIENLSEDAAYLIFNRLTPELRADVFIEFSRGRQKTFFVQCTAQEREILLSKLTIEELVDFFDDLSDQEVCTYIKLINKRVRGHVLSLLEFPENSAGGIMDSNVFVIPPDITITKVISILQRLRPNRHLYQSIFVVNQKQQLIGSIFLADLVLQEPSTQISTIMKSTVHMIRAETDKEEVAKYMMHYHLDILPVVNHGNTFLGVVTGGDLAEILEAEASEDIFRMASLAPQEDQYFDIPLLSLFWQRGSVLALLLLLQSISTIIISKYQSILAGFLLVYVGIVTSTGGNAGNQSSALVIRGIANGEINQSDMRKFIRRELVIASFLGLFLALIAFIRVYIFQHSFQECCLVGSALFFVVLLSTISGATMPFLLKRIGIDPAYAAGPLLATCMDIVGVGVFVILSEQIVKWWS